MNKSCIRHGCAISLILFIFTGISWENVLGASAYSSIQDRFSVQKCSLEFQFHQKHQSQSYFVELKFLANRNESWNIAGQLRALHLQLGFVGCISQNLLSNYELAFSISDKSNGHHPGGTEAFIITVHFNRKDWRSASLPP